MENTYTYTARNAENPEQSVTFTLHDHSMSVGLGAPLEQIEQVLNRDENQEDNGDGSEVQLWLKPLAISLVEQGTGPFRVADVDARADEDRLRVKAWFRTGGLGLAPITLIDGPIDNSDAAQAFVAEVNRRKEEVPGPFKLLGLLDYWATWIAASAALISLFALWRRKGTS
jgi:hypothetical protein